MMETLAVVESAEKTKERIRGRLYTSLPSNYAEAIGDSFIDRLLRGYLRYLETSETDEESYLMLRKVNYFTHGVFGKVFNDAVLWQISEERPDRKQEFGLEGREHTIDIVERGYTILPNRDNWIDFDGLWRDLTFIEYTCVDSHRSAELGFHGKPNSYFESVGMKYVASLESLLTLPTVLEIVSNHRLLSIAKEYLGGDVSIRSVDAWWKTSFMPKNYSSTADFFHRDCDHNQWLNLFVFLTPVTQDEGAHVFCPGTHQRTYQFSAGEIYEDKRYNETLINGKGIVPVAFECESPVAILEDTWGIHKASRCVSKSRLVLQIRFVRSSYGAQVRKVDDGSIIPILNSIFALEEGIADRALRSLTPLLKQNISPERLSIYS